MKLELTMPDDETGGEERYSYAYGLVSGMRSKLLMVKDFEVLALAVNVYEVIASLEKTDYNLEVGKIPSDYSDVDLESALKKNFTRMYAAAAGSMPEQDKRILDEIVFGESDLKNFKTILRGIHHSLNPLEIKLMLQPGSMKDETLEDLVNSNSVEEYASKLDSEYQSSLVEALAEYKKTDSILPVEMALDKTLVNRWLSSKPLLEYVKLKIDMLNLLNLFRCKSAEIEYQKHVLASGMHLNVDFLKSLEVLSVNEVVSMLVDTPYGNSLSKSISKEKVNPLEVEQALEQYMQEEVNVRAMLTPLSIWSVLAFIKLKQTEVRKLRVIMLLKAHHYPSEKIKKILG